MVLGPRQGGAQGPSGLHSRLGVLMHRVWEGRVLKCGAQEHRWGGEAQMGGLFSLRSLQLSESHQQGRAWQWFMGVMAGERLTGRVWGIV